MGARLFPILTLAGAIALSGCAQQHGRPAAACNEGMKLPYGKAVTYGSVTVCPAPAEWFVTVSAPVSVPVKPPAAPVVIAEKPPVAVSYLVFFPFGGLQITPENETVVAAAAKGARALGTRHIEITGHSDRVGGDVANLDLSLKRAETVRSALRRQGLEGIEITVTGRGFRQPLVPGSKREAQNRRAEIRLVD